MNTFLPYPEFDKSAACLDNKRLGKQRVEAWQIYLTLQTGPTKDCPVCNGWGHIWTGKFIGIKNETHPCSKCRSTGVLKTPWYNHPAVKMWEGYEYILLFYGVVMCEEWKKRGFKDTLEEKFRKVWKNHHVGVFPHWHGDDEFHAAYRSNLLRKDPVHYGQFGWKEPNNLPYVWPTKENK